MQWTAFIDAFKTLFMTRNCPCLNFFTKMDIVLGDVCDMREFAYYSHNLVMSVTA